MFPPAAWPDTDAVIIAFSGGKDSMIVLDLASQRGYRRLMAYHRYFLPDLEYTKSVVAFAKERYGIDVFTFQDPTTIDFIKRGTFCTARPGLTLWTMNDIEDYVRMKTGIEWVGVGYRCQESLERNAMLKRDWPYGINLQRRMFAPIRDWGPRHVKAYFAWRRLPLPPSAQQVWNGRSGFGLKPDHMAWARRYWPKDYERILTVFPGAAHQADRAEELDRVRAREKAERKHRRRGDAVPDLPVSGSASQ